MYNTFSKLLARIVFVVAILTTVGVPHAANKLTLLALFEGKALIHIDGQRRMLAVGETSPEGLTLMETLPDAVVVSVDGVVEELGLGLMTVFPGTDDTEAAPLWTGPATVSLWADANGFFYADGSVNGYPLRFLVDTGATTIALNRQTAERIGLALDSGKRALARTASGVAPMVSLRLDRVVVGNITLHNVEAGVLMGRFPETPLLGMSFLGQLDMVRESNRLDLKRRY